MITAGCPLLGGGFNRSTQHLLILLDEEVSMVTSRTWFTPQQRSELWERWKGGQCVADIARALERRNKSGVYRVLALKGGIAPMPRRRSRRALRLEESRRDLAWYCRRSDDTTGRTSPRTIALDRQSRDKA